MWRGFTSTGLRDHIARFPNGVWSQAVAVSKPLSLFESQLGSAAKDMSTGQALQRAQAGAERECRDFGAGTRPAKD